MRSEIFDHFGSSAAIKITFVYKNEGWDVSFAKKLPQGSCVRTNALGGTYNQNRIVLHPKRSLGFAGKIHVAGGVHEGDRRVLIFHRCLRGKDGDAALFFQSMGIHEGISAIHAAERLRDARRIKHCLGKRCFARIHVRKNAENDFFHKASPFPFAAKPCGIRFHPS